MKEQNTQKPEQIKLLLGRGGDGPEPNAPYEKALKWTLHFNLEHVHGPEEIETGEDELVVVCLLRDGRPWIKSFIEHYQDLGVKHIVFLDNGSTDGTPEAARDYENVTVLSTNLPFKRYQMAMKQYLMERFCRNRWSLCVDADELFDYPYSDVIGLDEFLGYLGERSYTAVAAQMLDMFSEEPLADVAPDGTDEPLKELYRFYDLSNVRRQRYSESPIAEAVGNVPANEEISILRGGVQETVFNSRALLTKHPLVFMDERVVPMDGTAHGVSNARIADVSCVLFHYKFTPRLYEQVRRAVRLENYMKDSRKHKKHFEVLEKTEALQLVGETSRELRDVNELVNCQFLDVSREYVRLVEEKYREQGEQGGWDGSQRLIEMLFETRAEARVQIHWSEQLQASIRQLQRELERERRISQRKAERLERQQAGAARVRRLQERIEDIEASRTWRLMSLLATLKTRLLKR